jgi:hypothetical protein
VHPARFFSFVALGLAGSLGCRQLLAIDDRRPTLADEADAGGTDAETDAAEAGGPGYCESLDPQPQFCADFDTAARVTSGFSNTGGSPDPFVTGDSTLAFDTVNFRSAPRAAAMGVAQLLAPSTASVALVKRFTGPPERLVYDLDLRIDTEDFRAPGQIVMLLSVTFPKGQIAIGRGKKGLSLAAFDGAVETEEISTELVPVGAWRRVSLVLTSSEITMQVNGVLAATLTRPAALGGKGLTYLGLGVVGAVGNMGPFRASFDNVSFTSNVALSD